MAASSLFEKEAFWSSAVTEILSGLITFSPPLFCMPKYGRLFIQVLLTNKSYISNKIQEVMIKMEKFIHQPCWREGTSFLHQEAERYMHYHSKKCTERKEENKT